MRKLLTVILGFVILASASIDCFAGDVPEVLLNFDSSQVYFGKVKSVDYDNKRITIAQYKNIKSGEFSEGKEIVYNKYVFCKSGSDVFSKDRMYLCGYSDENNPLHIWKVSSIEPESLSILESDNGMARRLEEYLNTGKFAEKEKERKEKCEKLFISSIMLYIETLKTLGGIF